MADLERSGIVVVVHEFQPTFDIVPQLLRVFSLGNTCLVQNA